MRKTIWLFGMACVASSSLFACKRDSRAPQQGSADLGAVTQHAPERARPTIWFNPMDLTTGVGEGALEISIDYSADLVDDSVLQSIEQQVRIEAEGTGRTVTANVVFVKAGDEFSRRANLTVLPTEPLDPGWYSLRVDRLPVGIDAPRFPSHTTFADGSIGVRFRRGSAPTLWGVRLCEKDEGTRLIVEFSEQLLAPPSTAGLVTVSQRGRTISCTPHPVGGASSFGSLALSCPTLDPEVEIEVEVVATVASPSGVSLRPSSHRFTPGSLANWGAGCRLYRGPA